MCADSGDFDLALELASLFHPVRFPFSAQSTYDPV